VKNFKKAARASSRTSKTWFSLEMGANSQDSHLVPKRHSRRSHLAPKIMKKVTTNQLCCCRRPVNNMGGMFWSQLPWEIGWYMQGKCWSEIRMSARKMSKNEVPRIGFAGCGTCSHTPWEYFARTTGLPAAKYGKNPNFAGFWGYPPYTLV